MEMINASYTNFLVKLEITWVQTLGLPFNLREESGQQIEYQLRDKGNIKSNNHLHQFYSRAIYMAHTNVTNSYGWVENQCGPNQFSQ